MLCFVDVDRSEVGEMNDLATTATLIHQLIGLSITVTSSCNILVVLRFISGNLSVSFRPL